MGRTDIRSGQIRNSVGVSRDDLDITTTGKAVIAKLLASTGITIASTGVDTGTGDVTVSVTANTTVQKGEVSKAGTLVGTRKRINFIDGTNVTITVADDAANDRVNITIAATGSGGTTDHAALTNLSFAASGHTGFEPSLAAGVSTQYYRGDKTWQTLNQAAVAGLTIADNVTFNSVTVNTDTIRYKQGSYYGIITRPATLTASRYWVFPDAGGTICLLGSSGTELKIDHIGELTASHTIVFDNTISNTGTSNLTTVNSTTLYVDIIREKTAGNKVVFNNDLSRAGKLYINNIGEATQSNKVVFDNDFSRVGKGYIDHIGEATASHTVVFDDDITLSAQNIITDTTTGMKIATGSTQKIGFFGATPVVRPTHVADPTTATSSLQAAIMGILLRLEALGLFASS